MMGSVMFNLLSTRFAEIDTYGCLRREIDGCSIVQQTLKPQSVRRRRRDVDMALTPASKLY